MDQKIFEYIGIYTFSSHYDVVVLWKVDWVCLRWERWSLLSCVWEQSGGAVWALLRCVTRVGAAQYSTVWRAAKMTRFGGNASRCYSTVLCNVGGGRRRGSGWQSSGLPLSLPKMRSQESYLYKCGGLHLSWVSVGLGGNMLRQIRETTLIMGGRRTMQHIILKDQTMFYPLRSYLL